MKKVSELFAKKSEKIVNGKKEIVATRTLVQEESFVLSLEEIERMEKNANVRIEMANKEIETANDKLKECAKLRKLL